MHPPPTPQKNEVRFSDSLAASLASGSNTPKLCVGVTFICALQHPQRQNVSVFQFSHLTRVQEGGRRVLSLVFAAFVLLKKPPKPTDFFSKWLCWIFTHE